MKIKMRPDGARAGALAQAVIGDQLRMLIMWCEMVRASPARRYGRARRGWHPGPRDRCRLGASTPLAGRHAPVPADLPGVRASYRVPLRERYMASARAARVAAGKQP